MKTKIIIIGAAAFIFLIIIISIFSVLSSSKKKPELPCYNQTITIWSPYKFYRYPEVANELKKYCVKLNVVEKSLDDIKNNLLQEISAGNSPDIVYVDSEFLFDNLNIFSPYKGNKLDLNDYPDVISKIFNGKFIAYPIDYNPLVLFWNKDLFYSAGYIEPPKTFEDIQNIIPKTRRISGFYSIYLSPIALGTTDNIDSFFEIFLVMHKSLNQNYKTSYAFEKTLDYYTQFADKNSDYFSWDQNMENQIDSFSKEKVMMIIDFYSKKDEILKKNSRLNFAITQIPTFSQNPKKLNYFSGHFFAIPKQGKNKLGWLFLEIFDKYYKNFVDKMNIVPTKKSFYDKLDEEKKIVFQSILNSDPFSEFNKSYTKDSLKQDIDNWIYRKKDVKQLLQGQVFKFFKK